MWQPGCRDREGEWGGMERSKKRTGFMCKSISNRTGRYCQTSNQADRQKKERRDFDVSYFTGRTQKCNRLNSIHGKTMRLSCSRLTSSVCSVDRSCLRLALIPESRSQSLRSIENAASALTVQLWKLLTNISVHKRFHICGVIMGQFQHAVTGVTDENAAERKI